ncbi:hypothetical protein [Acetivibrio ethanolgignens]|uniref:Uncharacterized protein n=1 Tax=Acetivibrio ethanolgignens TaxID=290052 RepID=A0A0V8QIG4_9FIRM|nr:hypothetical protein [Acetivibrio ethanolgignens]KSV59881.1 hypothetical protein ASU35_07715 [Acetivibrio ethanolgignens]
MIFKTTISQTAFMLKKKETVCVFYVLFFIVIINFIGNVLYFQDRDILEMYQPMKLLLLSYNRTNWNATNTLLLIQLYPLLVVCPAGFSLAREYQIGTRFFLVSRLGNFTYLVSKYLSAFLTTMIIFTVPFLLEIILNCLSFPLSATGDLSNLSIYDSAYRIGVNHYFMKSIYLYSPCLYAVIGTLFFGAVSGLFGVFTVAVSSIKRVKYNIFLFLPVFVALNMSTILANGFPEEAPSIKWYDYVLLFNDELKSISFGLIGIFGLVLFLIGAICVSGRKDCL